VEGQRPNQSSPQDAVGSHLGRENSIAAAGAALLLEKGEFSLERVKEKFTRPWRPRKDGGWIKT